MLLNAMPDYDHSYKLLFSHKEMVADLLDVFTSVQREEEVDAMLATRLEEWKSNLRAKYLEEGIEKGKEEERAAIAKQMLAEGIDETLVARACGLTVEKIAALKKQA